MKVFLYFCDRYLSVEVNIKEAESMKSIGEKVLFDTGKCHADMRNCLHFASEKVIVLKN